MLRLFSEFNDTNEYLIVVGFAYAFLHSCSTLLVLDSQFVEYQSQ